MIEPLVSASALVPAIGRHSDHHTDSQKITASSWAA
jgi:hypothetical protein